VGESHGAGQAALRDGQGDAHHRRGVRGHRPHGHGDARAHGPHRHPRHGGDADRGGGAQERALRHGRVHPLRDRSAAEEVRADQVAPALPRGLRAHRAAHRAVRRRRLHQLRPLPLHLQEPAPAALSLRGRMKRSPDRILTTPTGSLPRPPDLLAMVEAIDAGTSVDATAFDARVASATRDIVRQQAKASVDVVNDGEQGKVGYSTYVRQRLTGFGGQSTIRGRADRADFPEAAARAGQHAPVARAARNGPIEWKDRAGVDRDIANFRAALEGAAVTEAFMTAASPGVIAHFLPNQYFPNREAYLARLVDVMKEEYDAIHRAGFVLQI